MVSLPVLVVLALLGGVDRPSTRHLQTLAEQAELDRLRISEFAEVSAEEDVDRLGGRLYVYQTSQGDRLLWVSATSLTDDREAHILGVVAGGVGEFVLADMDGDGGLDFAFVENHGSGMAIQRVVGYRVGEWAGPPAFAEYVSHGSIPVHLRASENPPRLEVLCRGRPLGWFQLDRSLGTIVYEESDLPLPECRVEH